jgi:SEC-C motif-containing protein
MKIAPVHLRGRWIDDGSPVELWNEDRSIGVRLAAMRANKDAPGLAVMELQRISVEAGDYTRLHVDLASGEIRSVVERGSALDPPLDLAWLQGQLDGELREALQQRLVRQPRANHPQDWLDGDRPRAAPGEHVVFAQLFPSAWDVVVRHDGRRYVVIDSYRVTPEAAAGPVGLEIVDLETGESIGAAQLRLEHARKPPTGRRWAPPWRSRNPAVGPILTELLHDVDHWLELVNRSEVVARTARVMQSWESDLRDLDAVVALLLAEPGGEDEALIDRMKALGRRSVPALRRALQLAEPSASRYAARLLARLGDASGVDQLVAALVDPDFDDPSGQKYEIVDDIAALEEKALEPLLAALASVGDGESQDWLLDTVNLLAVHDDRLRDLLIEVVRADPGRASRLGDYGDRSPAVVTLLRELLAPRVDALRDGRGDAATYDDAYELAAALRDLGVHDGPVQQFAEIVEARRAAQRDATRGERRFDDLNAYEPYEPLPRPTPVHVTPRPGRNEPCWCGSNKKYKKCHLEADAAAPAR